MIVEILKSIQTRRAAARNYRILSALDDTVLFDVGLDRRTLRTFCDNGCSDHAPIGGKAAPVPAVLMPGGLTPALR
ncbi:hypothetical protein [Methylobacterium pseudosasicola]|uniref:DUF1127 domain-containing protein n=1 Tax=Methylobacterium pseudosasicola TaxID=582667 RepID=A0A1I4I2X0_9HYPH|nr:hypothetical protein [Methylobacterium pseudosasicola]SFL48705.1 hypothetical protein SAMN05192568_1005226 [Methylobacterium pseudosasicola]